MTLCCACPGPHLGNWLSAGLEVRDRLNRRAVVRGAADNGLWLVRYLDVGTDVPLRADEFAPVVPGKDDRARVISGAMQGEVVVVLGIDGTDAVVRGADPSSSQASSKAIESDVKMYKLTALCKIGRV